MTTNSAPQLIAIDWGTSSFRAALLGADGRMLAELRTGDGILRVADGQFESLCQRRIEPWLAKGPLPVLACGMIGSRQGWREAPYRPCPAGIAELAASLQVVQGERLKLHIVPGLVCHRGALRDVMRGEETQIVGQLVADNAPLGDPLLVLPGTHCKWADLRDGKIDSFRTFMTGELFEALSQHTILGRLMAPTVSENPPPESDEAFLRGLAAAEEAGLLGNLFTARTLPLFEQLRHDEVGAYLSGLLIGAEIREALAGPAAEQPDRECVVLGEPQLASKYVAALRRRGLTARSGVPSSASQGLWTLAAAAGILGD